MRDVNFNVDGTSFLSASYDKSVKLWDTETGKIPICSYDGSDSTTNISGQVKSRFPMRKIPYCVAFNPSEHKQHLFICGMSDRKILCVSLDRC